MNSAFVYLDFAPFFNILATKTSVKCKWNFLETPIQSVQEKPQSFILTHLFFDPHFKKYLNPLVRTKKLVNSVFYHPCHSRLASGTHLFIYISLTPSGFTSLESLLNFLWLVYSNMCEKNFSIHGVHIPRKFLHLCFLTHVPVTHSELLVEVFENLFPPTQKGFALSKFKNHTLSWFALSKFNQKIWRWFGKIVYFHLVRLQLF